MLVGANAAKAGRKYVLWGASVGPFRNTNNLSLVSDNLKLCSLITVREKLAYDYVCNRMRVAEHTRLVADPAFCMDPDRNVDFRKVEGCVYIGLNLSELAVRHACRDEEVDAFLLSLFASLDQVLAQDEQVRYVCVPHVMCDDGIQNDIVFMNRYLQHTAYRSRIEILSARLGARKTKGILEKMDMVIAARMHCCVGAISVATPTLFVAYSNKGRGMSYYAYGHHDYEVEVKEMVKKTFLEKVKGMLAHREQIRAYLKNQQPRFYEDALLAGKYLSQIDNVG